MRGKFLFGIGLLAFAGAGVESAVAADFPVKAAPPPVAVSPAYVPDWVGFYVGIHGGGGWGHESFEPSESFSIGGVVVPFVTPPGTDPKGGVFGFQFGHNWQWGPVVGGLEIDFSGADLTGSNVFFNPFLTGIGVRNQYTVDKKVDELASARGRLGYLIFPNWLLYGTAGIGWGHERITTTANIANVVFSSETSELNEFGWVAGVGLEWKFAPNWLLRGEWLHYDFARVVNPNNNAIQSTILLLDNGNVRTTVDVARAALSYKF